VRKLALVPAFNEAGSIGAVIDEIRDFDAAFDILVVDDGSHDDTRDVAVRHGAQVVTLPFNLGIGAAVQTGLRLAAARGYDLVVRIDGDGQHDPVQISQLLPPVLAGEVDICVGSRFVEAGGYQSSLTRRLGIRVLARTVSLLTRQRITDPTSGFQALNRKAIELFAVDYPHDYPEVEAAILLHKHRLRLAEVPVTMRERATGVSSIGALSAVYYMFKVLLAVLIGMLRRSGTPLEDV
jgi:glycosyltransferase involved in cell wall biosynthesis